MYVSLPTFLPLHNIPADYPGVTKAADNTFALYKITKKRQICINFKTQKLGNYSPVRLTPG